MTVSLLEQVLWLSLPVMVGGMIHIATIRANILSGLARLPLDFNVTLRGRRLLGANKTVRGAVVMTVATTAAATCQGLLWHRYTWARCLSLLDFDRVPAPLWGALLGIGYIIGELPNSFTKRQLDVPPGKRAPGVLGPILWTTDQLDSFVGILSLIAFVWIPPATVAIALALMTLVVHPAMGLLMVALGLKRWN